MRNIYILLLFLVAAMLNCTTEHNLGAPPPPASTWSALYDSLSPLLIDSTGNKLLTVDEWEKQRDVIRNKWNEVLGYEPEILSTPRADTLNTIEEEKYIRYHIRFQTEAGSTIEAYLLVPTKTGTFPAVVCFHSTSDNTIDQPAGLADKIDVHFGKYLAEQGYITIMPRNFIYAYRSEEPVKEEEFQLLNVQYPSMLKNRRIADNTIRLLRRHPHWTGLGKMIWDGSRCIDFLQSLHSVQRDKIGVIGHSLGGKQALFLPAFDDRIVTAVSCEGGIGLTFTNWFDPWYIGDKKSLLKGMETHQVLSLIAPRAFMLIAGESADGDRSFAYLKRAEDVYDLYRKKDRLVMYNHKQGHAVTMKGVAEAIQWLDLFLK